MGKSLTEQKVLKKLGIPDFRHLTKAKAITMVSMLDKMDPEVAKKALEQFPDFSNTIKEILAEYKESLDRALESNETSVKSYYDSCDSIIHSLQEELEKSTLSFDERKYIIDKMIEIQKMKGDKDSENKKFIATLSAFATAAAGIAAVALLSALGGNTKLEANDFDPLT